ncbi:MAG TPA: DUF1109 domain-containing protein [Casimicrobiaceae bacterium]
MTTDELIERLALPGGAVDAHRVVRRYVGALGVGTGLAVLAMASMLGPRHDFAQAVALPMFWVKLAFVASLAILGVVAAFRVGMPARRLSTIAWAIAAVIGSMWIVAAVALVESAPGARMPLLLGATWTSCPWLIAGLSIPMFAAVAWAMRRMAPTRLRIAGATAGFASGATAALVYAIHCPELGAPFLGTWYVLGMLIPTAIGALLGERLFRW